MDSETENDTSPQVEPYSMAVLAFDMEGTGKSFDLLVKDLDSNELMPVLIVNTDAQVAFDNFAGFFYT